jgi:hypothetical protein
MTLSVHMERDRDSRSRKEVHRSTLGAVLKMAHAFH